jgi:hypothetical protein
MLLIVDILLVAYIIVPLCDLVFNERVRIPIKIAVYVVALAWVLYWLFAGRAGV